MSEQTPQEGEVPEEVQGDGGALSTDPAAGVDQEAAPAVVFGYLPGFAAGVQAGYLEGRRDLERSKSDAAADGFARGVRAAEQFPPTSKKPGQLSTFEVACYATAAGLLLGTWLEKRAQRRERAEQEGDGYELPDVRS